VADKPINERKGALSLRRKFEISANIADGLSGPGSDMADIQPSVLVRRLHAKLKRLTEVLLVITDCVEWRGSSPAATKKFVA